MGPQPKDRCWMWGKGCCRKPATGSTRIGNHVFHHCDDHNVWPICAADKKDVKPTRKRRAKR